MAKAYTFNRAEIYARLFVEQRGKCKQCGKFDPTLQVDHVVPSSRGGADVPANWQLLCRNCNVSKNAEISAGAQRVNGNQLQCATRTQASAADRRCHPDLHQGVLAATTGDPARETARRRHVRDVRQERNDGHGVLRGLLEESKRSSEAQQSREGAKAQGAA